MTVENQKDPFTSRININNNASLRRRLSKNDGVKVNLPCSDPFLTSRIDLCLRLTSLQENDAMVAVKEEISDNAVKLC